MRIDRAEDSRVVTAPGTGDAPDARRDPAATAPCSDPHPGEDLPVPGSIVQQYEIIRPLGRGGMGTVFLARDRSLGRLVAIKLVTEHGGERARRFLVEARATAQISHENIVIVHELGEHFGRPYLVLEYVKGWTLAELLRDRRGEHGDAVLPPSRAVELMIPVVRALVCAHERGIVHRDLKPSNIMMSESGLVKVVDFGVAKLEGLADAGGVSAAPERGGARESEALTATGARLGTALYMSPEQWRGDPVDHRADLWSVGLILAEMVVGRHPLAAAARDDDTSRPAGSTTQPEVTVDRLDVSRLSVPMPSVAQMRPALGRLGSIIDRCLFKRREDRWGSARELLGELEALLPPHRRPRADEDHNPYAGLAAFREGDAGRFFGRARMIREVIARLAEHPLVTLVGRSGAGKSSFVRAGIIPALEHAGDAWEAFTIRPGGKPLAAMAALLLADASSPTVEDREELVAGLRAEPGSLGTWMRARARRRATRILLFVDQLEELYTLAPEEDHAAFFACLAGVADDPGSPLRVVLAIRSDFLDRVAEAHDAMTGLSRGITLLSPMDREGLREALVRPLDAVRHAFDPPGLVEEMLDTLEHTAGALPLLSFTAAQLWENRDRSRRSLTVASYRRIGGVAGTLAGHAEALLGAMSAEERLLARTALLRLVTPERTRAPCALAELRQLGAAPLDMERVLARMIEARLLTVEGGGEADTTVELVHESLIADWPALSRWVAENQDDAALISRLRHAAREWEAGGRSDDLLWRGRAAEDAERWRSRYEGELAPAEERYLASVIALRGRARRLQRGLFGSAVVALATIAAVVSILAVRADRVAIRAREEARQARNAARITAARELVADPTTALSLLREVEPPGVPRGWSELSRWALDAGVARAVLTHPEQVLRAALSPDGRRVATTSVDTAVRVWSADGSGEPLILRGHDDHVWFAAWSPDGERIATASTDRTVRVWNADGRSAPVILRGHTDAVFAAEFAPGGDRLVTASKDGTARVWRADGSGEPLLLRAHDGPLWTAAWAPDGTRIAIGSKDGTAEVWRADGTGEPVILRGHTKGVGGVAWSPGGDRLVTASHDGTARVWSAGGGRELLVLREHEGAVNSAAWSRDGARILTASGDRTARVWSADGKGAPLVLRGHREAVWSAAFGLDGCIVTASKDGTARVWSAGGPVNLLVYRGRESIGSAVAWSPDGERLVMGAGGKVAEVWRPGSGAEPLALRGHEDAVWTTAWSPDGKRIATGSDDRTARLWSADGTGEPVVLRGHEDTVWAVGWSPDGRRVVTGSADGTARVWSADGTGEPVVLRGHQKMLWSAAFGPDGRRIVTGSEDRTARVWSADGTGEPIVLRHVDVVGAAAFSPDGRRIVTGSRDKLARVWNADGTGEPIVLRDHDNWINWVEWSPDGNRILTASQDQTVRLWNADGTGEPMVLRGATHAYNRAAWSPDGKRIAAPAEDQTIWIWADLQPLAGSDDPRLWAATTYCLPVARRREILGVPLPAAQADLDRCQRRVNEVAARGSREAR